MAHTKRRSTRREAPKHEQPLIGDDTIQHHSSTIIDGFEPPPTLMSIPPELRVRIYQYALIKNDPLVITPLLCQPPLLRVCRLIRREALDIHYLKNKYAATVNDRDAQLLASFTLPFPKHSPGERLAQD